MTNDEIRRRESDARDSLNELKEATEFALDSIERVGIFSKRTASVCVGTALGAVLGIFCVTGAFGIRPESLSKYQDLLVFSTGIAGAGAGALLVKESGEEKARRLEIAASKLGEKPNLAEFRQNILDEHRLITRSNAAKEAALDQESRKQYLLQSATHPEFSLELVRQIPQQITEPPLEE